MDVAEQPVLVVLNPSRPDRHLRIDHHDDLVERQAPGLVFGQERGFLGADRLAAPFERVLTDGARARNHGLGGLADRLAQLLHGLLVGWREVKLHTRVALQGAPGVLAVDFVEGGDGLGDHGQMTAIGAQGFDTLDHDGHFAQTVELIEHDHHRPGLVGTGVLFLHGGEQVGKEEPDQRGQRFHHEGLDDEIDREGLFADRAEIKIRHGCRLVDRRVLPLIEARGHQKRNVRGQRVIVGGRQSREDQLGRLVPHFVAPRKILFLLVSARGDDAVNLA